MREKSNLGKEVLKIFISIIVFIIMILIILIIRKFIILSNLEQLAKKKEDINNYSYKIFSYYTEEERVTKTESYVIDNKFLITGNIYKNEDNVTKITIYYDGIDKIGLVEENGKKMSTINGVNSDNLTIDGNSTKLNQLGIFSYDILKSPINIFSLKILTDECNSKQCYLVQIKDGTKYWIDKETGIVVRVIYSSGYVEDYSYEINNVTDNDIIKPEI